MHSQDERIFLFRQRNLVGGNSRFFKTVAMLDFVLGKSLFIYLLFVFAIGNCELQQTEQGQDWS